MVGGVKAHIFGRAVCEHSESAQGDACRLQSVPHGPRYFNRFGRVAMQADRVDPGGYAFAAGGDDCALADHLCDARPGEGGVVDHRAGALAIQQRGVVVISAVGKNLSGAVQSQPICNFRCRRVPPADRAIACAAPS